MSMRTFLNATAIVLTVGGLALIGITTVLMLEARPTSSPAGTGGRVDLRHRRSGRAHGLQYRAQRRHSELQPG